jgi:hypothetical protein
MAKVIAQPNSQLNHVTLTDGGDVWTVPPEEVFLMDLPVKATTNKAPLLVIRGEHVGKYLWQIFYTYQPNVEEPLITAASYSAWGTSSEKRIEDHIEVKAEDCAFTAKDPNKSLFKDEITQLRKRARQSPNGAKTPRRPKKQTRVPRDLPK